MGCMCERESYLWGLVGSPAVLVAVQAGQQHVLIRVHLAETQRLVCVVTDHVVAVDQLLGVRLRILSGGEKSRVVGLR